MENVLKVPILSSVSLIGLLVYICQGQLEPIQLNSVLRIYWEWVKYTLLDTRVDLRNLIKKESYSFALNPLSDAWKPSGHKKYFDHASSFSYHSPCLYLLAQSNY